MNPSAGNQAIELPDEIPSGFVDIRVEASRAARHTSRSAALLDGVTFEEFTALPPDDLATMVSDVIGKGTVRRLGPRDRRSNGPPGHNDWPWPPTSCHADS